MNNKWTKEEIEEAFKSPYTKYEDVPEAEVVNEKPENVEITESEILDLTEQINQLKAKSIKRFNKKQKEYGGVEGYRKVVSNKNKIKKAKRKMANKSKKNNRK